MNNFEIKLLAVILFTACAIIIGITFYNMNVHNDRMKAYYTCLDKQELVIKESVDKWSTTNLYCHY